MKRRSIGILIATVVSVVFGGLIANANDDAPSDAADRLAGDVIGLAKLMEEQHYESPAKQQVVLQAARALHGARKNLLPKDLVSRCSGATNDEELRRILTEACGAGFSLTGEVRAAIGESIAKTVPGGVQLLSRKAGAAQQQLTENRYVGVGIAAKGSSDGELEVGAVMPGGPIARAGVKEGTVIKLIDGWATKGQSMEEAVERLRGPEGTPVTLTLQSPVKDQQETVTLYRGVVPQKMLSVEVSDEAGRRIAVLRPRELGGSVAHEIQQLAQTDRELDGVLLDLRGVSGRAHFAALVADQFLDGGEIGSIEKGTRRVPLKAEDGELFPDVPLAIATDPSTTGSAAWLATLLMERKRAMVFGQKGEQLNLDYQTFELPSGETARFATMVLVTPGGARTLVVSERTQVRIPDASDVVSAIASITKDASNPFGLPRSKDERRELRLQQELDALKQQQRLLKRDSLVIAKEYLQNLRSKKGEKS